MGRALAYTPAARATASSVTRRLGDVADGGGASEREVTCGLMLRPGAAKIPLRRSASRPVLTSGVALDDPHLLRHPGDRRHKAMAGDTGDRMKIVIGYAVWATLCAAVAGVVLSLIHTWFFSYHESRPGMWRTLLEDIATSVGPPARQGGGAPAPPRAPPPPARPPPAA